MTDTDLIRRVAEQVLAKHGRKEVDVYVSPHTISSRTVVQVLLDMPVAQDVFDQVQAAVEASHPETGFEFVRP